MSFKISQNEKERKERKEREEEEERNNERINEDDSMLEQNEILKIQNNIAILSKQRSITLVDRSLSRTSSGRKYERFNHMGDVVDEVLTRTGLTLQEISRLNESIIDSAERSAFGTLQKVNDYRVLAELARGSFGVVYLVEDDHKKSYAMKAFPFAKAKKTLTRGRMPGKPVNEEIDLIRREIALMKKLNHPYIVRLYEVVEEKIYPHSIYMILEYVSGGPIMTLKQMPTTPSLARDISISSVSSDYAIPLNAPQWESSITGSVLGEALASKLFRQLISAMQYLHLNAVAHRDLKPENILITLDGDIKVADFGVSQDFGNETSIGDDDDGNNNNKKTGLVRDTKGSWPFWSPEMIDNHQSNAYSAYSADVWASGVCLWIFIYGTLPFWAPGPSHVPDPIFEQILSTKTTKPRFPSRRSPELCDLLLDIFSVDPNRRPTFQDLSKYTWIQQHSQVEIETRLNAFSSISVDCSEIHLDMKTAVTPGEVNFLSENAKSHFVRMAQRVKEKVRQRHQDLIAAKDEEIETKKEEMKHYDPTPSQQQQSPPPPPPNNTSTPKSTSKSSSTVIPPPPSSSAAPLLGKPSTDSPTHSRPSSMRKLSQSSNSPSTPSNNNNSNNSNNSNRNSFRNNRSPSQGVDNTLDQPIPTGLGRDISQNTNFTNRTDPIDNHDTKPLNPIEKKDSSSENRIEKHEKSKKGSNDSESCCIIL